MEGPWEVVLRDHGARGGVRDTVVQNLEGSFVIEFEEGQVKG